MRDIAVALSIVMFWVLILGIVYCVGYLLLLQKNKRSAWNAAFWVALSVCVLGFFALTLFITEALVLGGDQLS